MMLYAINKETKEHIAINLSEWLKWNAGKWLSMKWTIVGVNEDGWIPWNAVSGAKCPISKDQKYVVKLANGEDIDCTLNRPVIRWDDNPPSSTRVIAYKPIIDSRTKEENKSPEWDDNEIPGLPSVGCIVEAYDGGRWAEAEFLKFHSNSYAVFFIKSRALCWVTDIRPARSIEDKVVDEMVVIIGLNAAGGSRCVARALYGSGYRKVEESYD